jgi:hypoxanthine phosphoribosyltransferase
MTNSIPVSYEQTNRGFRSLVQKIQDSKKTYDGILAVANGGLPLAYYLAKALDLPIECVSVKSYEGTTSGVLSERTIEGNEKHFIHPERVLLVDDIYDSGKTLAFLQQKYPEMDTAVLYLRWERDLPQITFCAEVLNHDSFLEFPWEKDFY